MKKSVIAGLVVFVFVICLIPVIINIASNDSFSSNDYVFSTLFTSLSNIKSPINITSVMSQLYEKINTYNSIASEIPVLSWLLLPLGFIDNLVSIISIFVVLLFNAVTIALQTIVVALTAPFSLIVA